MRRPKPSWLVLPLVLLILLPFRTAAAGGTGAPGITVSPAQLNVVLDGRPNQTIPVTITNGYDVSVSLAAQFKGIDEAAGLLVPTDTLDPTLASALHISQTDIVLPAHSAQVVDVQISNASALAPGGHYATLVLTQQGGGNQLSLNASITLALFVIKPDGARPALRVDDVKTDGWLLRLPTRVTMDFVNTGNVHTVPRAAIDVRAGNRLLAHGVANTASLALLPGYTLSSSADLTGLGHTWLPRHLLVRVVYRADGSSSTHTITRSLWYVPPVYLLAVPLIGLIIYYLRRKPKTTPVTPKVSSFDSAPLITPVGPPKTRINITVRDAMTGTVEVPTPVKVKNIGSRQSGASASSKTPSKRSASRHKKSIKK